MAKKQSDHDVKGITVKKDEDIAAWYEQVCLRSEIVSFGTAKGTVVIRPRGYYIWQQIQDTFNRDINDRLDVENTSFPLFIPESFFKKEAEHAKGFSPEVAWLDKSLTGDGERLAIRPTSETIMYDSFSDWIRSYNDLPLKINQWCNVVRWETSATKLLLRGREFLWQEGHCVHETEDACSSEVKDIILSYQKLARDVLALPTIVGKKTPSETFAGAKFTYTIEAFMPDGKALQAGTSHHLGQGFSKVFGIEYLGRDEKKHYPWQNSWGLSTRLIGGAVMTHSDDRGLVLSPRVARHKLVVTPLFFKGKEDIVLEASKKVLKSLKSFNPVFDERQEHSPGYRFSEWEMKGIPLRVEVGPKDIEKNQAVIVFRHSGKKLFVPLDSLKDEVTKALDVMHEELYESAAKFLEKSIVSVSTWKEFTSAVNSRKVVKASFCGEDSCEAEIKDETGGVTSRCISFDDEVFSKECVHCKKPSKNVVFFSKSY